MPKEKASIVRTRTAILVSTTGGVAAERGFEDSGAEPFLEPYDDIIGEGLHVSFFKGVFDERAFGGCGGLGAAIADVRSGVSTRIRAKHPTAPGTRTWCMIRNRTRTRAVAYTHRDDPSWCRITLPDTAPRKQGMGGNTARDVPVHGNSTNVAARRIRTPAHRPRPRPDEPINETDTCAHGLREHDIAMEVNGKEMKGREMVRVRGSTNAGGEGKGGGVASTRMPEDPERCRMSRSVARRGCRRADAPKDMGVSE
ncbi:hypothetical protein C8F04DRAFT_1198801 [Mycena alexandri]|uniref:Uncharacterized protein n=1 Tax=Mycena alexandri TaxID=1745969 RepID=A0AAD6S0I3_9AGAR|nr:hypothetical protein C8F04DRAFT_1198801 [Mycena alexandri]